MGEQLTGPELLRYNRHIILPEIGVEGQQKLKDSSVLLIGAGGLGAPVAMYLAAAGVGCIGIVDGDVVDASNLHRQIIHDTSAIGKRKTDSAKARLREINPHIKVSIYDELFTTANALQIAEGYDVLIDGTDNFPTRYLTNDVSVLLGKPNIYGSIFRFEGQVSVFWAEKGPCYRCLYEEPPPPGLVPNCAEAGVLGILPGVVGTLQATEAIKVLLGIGEPLIGRLLIYDALGMTFRQLNVRKNPECPICGDNPTISELIDYEEFCGVPANDHIQQPTTTTETMIPEISVQEYAELKEQNIPHVLVDVREPHEYEIANMGGVLIPLGQLQERVSEIPKDQRVVVHCRSGARSANAVRFLQSVGYSDVQNLAGGINEWASKIDTSLPTY